MPSASTTDAHPGMSMGGKARSPCRSNSLLSPVQVIRDELRKKDNAVGGDVSDSSDDEPDENEPQGSAPSITAAGGR